MPRRNNLGEFEQLVLLGLASVGDAANGREIYDEIVKTTGREVSITAVHVTLRRLEKKGLCSAQLGDADETDGPRKLYTLEDEGAAALRASREMFEQMWKSAKLHTRLRG